MRNLSYRQSPAPTAVKNVHFRHAGNLRRANPRRCWLFSTMEQMKDTRRALVRIGYDGRVHKTFRGHQAAERFENEIRVLRYLFRTRAGRLRPCPAKARLPASPETQILRPKF